METNQIAYEKILNLLYEYNPWWRNKKIDSCINKDRGLGPILFLFHLALIAKNNHRQKDQDKADRNSIFLKFIILPFNIFFKPTLHFYEKYSLNFLQVPTFLEIFSFWLTIPIFLHSVYAMLCTVSF